MQITVNSPLRNRALHAMGVKGAWALCCLLVAGCATSAVQKRPTAPPPSSAMTTLDAMPAALRLLVAEWYSARFSSSASAGDLFAMRQRRLAAEAQLFAEWRSALTAQYRPAIREQGSVRVALRPEGLAALGKPDVIHSHMEALRTVLAGGLPLGLSAEALNTFFGQADLQSCKNDFTRWCRTHVSALPLPQEFNLPALLEAIRKADAAAAVKQQLLDALAASARQEKEGHISAALDVLDEALRSVPAKGGLQAIGDVETVAAVHERLQRLPRTAIIDLCRDMDTHELATARHCVQALAGPDEDLERCATVIDAAEKRLSENLAIWLRDERFAQPLQEQGATIVELAQLVARTRAREWGREVELAAETQGLIKAMDLAGGFLQAATNYEPGSFAAYRYADSTGQPQNASPTTCARLICDEIRMQTTIFLPDAMTELLDIAEREIDVSLRHGSGIALCSEVLRLRDLLGDLPASPRIESQVQRAQLRLERSSASLQRTILARTLVIQPFSSDEPGLGLTYAKDLAAQLRELLGPPGSGRFVELRDVGAEPTPRDLGVVDGHLADFNADEVTEAESIRRESRWGPITAAAIEGQSAGAVSQSLMDYVIRVKRLERIAHIRLNCDVLRDDRRVPIRINEFFRKASLQESMHPFQDVRIARTETATDKGALHPEEGEPKLKNQRIWTSGEVLDWARRQVQRLTAVLVLLELDAEPFSLAARARVLDQKDNVAVAADAWGIAYEALRHRQPDPAHYARQAADTSEVSPPLRKALEQKSQQESELLQLQEAVAEGLRQAVSRLLVAERRRRSQVAP